MAETSLAKLIQSCASSAPIPPPLCLHSSLPLALRGQVALHLTSAASLSPGCSIDREAQASLLALLSAKMRFTACLQQPWLAQEPLRAYR